MTDMLEHALNLALALIALAGGGLFGMGMGVLFFHAGRRRRG